MNKRLIIIALGIVKLFYFKFLFKNIIGAKKQSSCCKNLNKVREMGLIIPDNFTRYNKEPATKKVANNTK